MQYHPSHWLQHYIEWCNFVIVFSVCFNAMSTFLMFKKLWDDFSLHSYVASEGFENSVCGSWSKKFVHHWRKVRTWRQGQLLMITTMLYLEMLITQCRTGQLPVISYLCVRSNSGSGDCDHSWMTVPHVTYNTKPNTQKASRVLHCCVIYVNYYILLHHFPGQPGKRVPECQNYSRFSTARGDEDGSNDNCITYCPYFPPGVIRGLDLLQGSSLYGELRDRPG